jgi:diguanylate cyclase (GGDEF)-like protein
MIGGTFPETMPRHTYQHRGKLTETQAIAMPDTVETMMTDQPNAAPRSRPVAANRAERDVIGLGIIVAAILLFVGTGSTVLTRLMRHLLLGEANAETALTNALLLNIALIIFGWRRYVDLTREVAARRDGEAKAWQVADSDPLTGVLNRRSFDAEMARLAGSVTKGGTSLVLILIDLDRFKHANDSHGHQVGDAVLIETARRIRAILPGDAALARPGGDEFAALVAIARGPDTGIQGVTGNRVVSQIDRIVAAIGAAIALPIECGEHTLAVTASIGVACESGTDGRTVETMMQSLVHHADVAMYQAKKSGRSRHCWFDPAMEAQMLARSRMEQAIRQGLKNGEFRPYYEKQVDLATGEITGLEMLARWHSPTSGVIGPDVFVPVAEEIGVMPELSETLIRQALADARGWAAHLTLAINISPVQLRDPWFAQRLLKLLIEARMPPHRLDIEITEQCLNENLAMVRSLVTSLRNQGVRISLDDFGHSASSLAHLRALPFDRIKIDRNFIAGLGECRESAAVVEAISSLGRGMDLAITAEGIESAQILTELRKLGAFRGQGYVYGQPMSAQALHSELAELHLLAPAPELAAELADRHRA